MFSLIAMYAINMQVLLTQAVNDAADNHDDEPTEDLGDSSELQSLFAKKIHYLWWSDKQLTRIGY